MNSFFDNIESIMRSETPIGAAAPRVRPTDDDIAERVAAYSESMEFTPEHLKTFKAIFQDHRNVFLTGGAGTGKSMMTYNAIIPELNHRGLNFSVTASTGIAGSHVGGRTLHSWAGIGLGPTMPTDKAAIDLSEERVLGLYRRTYEAWSNNSKMKAAKSGIIARIKACEVLVIDEVGMCAGVALIDYLDFFFKQLRGNDKPYGGIQMIFVGDFMQLPPVEKVKTTREDWAFLSRSWLAADVKFCELRQVYRQADQRFAEFLNRRRFGYPMDAEEQVYAKSFCRAMTVEDRTKATYLVTTNAKADTINEKFLALYPGELYHINAKFHCEPETLQHYETPERVKEQIVKGKVLRDPLRLRVGLPVLITVNSPEGEYFNGTKCFVESVKLDEEDFSKSIITLRIPAKKKKPEAQEEPAELPTTAETAGDDDENEEQFAAFIKVQKEPAVDPEYEDKIVHFRPRAYFRSIDSDKEDDPNTPRLWQFPVIPATAITVHKAQGMSLDECVVDLSNAFASGHVYVALSRLRSADGLTLISDKFDLKSDKDALSFYTNSRLRE